MMRHLFLVGLLMVVGVWRARAEEVPEPLRGVTIDQRLNEQVPLDLSFRDEEARPVRLGDYIHDKPVILVLAYFRCPMLCTQVLNGLVEALRGLPFDIGNQFEVVTVSFDPRESPALAAAKKANYVADYGRPNAAAGWHFLTGQQEAIDRLTQAVGFRYRHDPETDQFAHASGIMVLTPQGKLARYFYGIKYETRDLRLSLVEASHNRIGSPVDQLLLFCYHYDAGTGRYTPVVMNFVRLGGILTLVILGTFMIRSWRRDRRRADPVEHLPVPDPAGLP